MIPCGKCQLLFVIEVNRSENAVSSLSVTSIFFLKVKYLDPMSDYLKTDPYWWDAASPKKITEWPIDSICDVAIVGAGYAGLSAALTLARAGRAVQIFDRQNPGEGASTRNGGIASGNIHMSFQKMTKKFGLEYAKEIYLEGKLARLNLSKFIADERIDCDFHLVG